jgi:hypothetical protein
VTRSTRRRAPGRSAAAAVLALALVAPACSRGHTPAPPRPTGPPALELVADAAQQFGLAPVPVGTYVAYGVSTGAVHEPVRIVAVRPLVVKGDVEFATAKLALYVCDKCRRHPGAYGVRRLLGSTCGPYEPGNRALVPAVGVDLLPGDAPHLILVGRTTGPGDATISGAEVTYRAGGVERTVSTPVHGLTVDASAPPVDPPCPDPKKESWFGGSDERDATAPLG